MGTCINHPDRETPYLCMKHQLYLCEACLECRDPKIYCKHRSACPIWFMGKRKESWEADDRQAAAAEIHVASCSGKSQGLCAGLPEPDYRRCFGAKKLTHCKGAVYADFTTLLREAGMDFSMGDHMIITGGLGQYLNIEKAVTSVLFDTGIHERLNKLSLEQKKSDK